MYIYQGHRSKNAVQDWLDDETGKAAEILDERISAARDNVIEAFDRTLASDIAHIQQLTGVTVAIGKRGAYNDPKNDSPMGKSIASAIQPLTEIKLEILELAREYRLKASLGKAADDKMAILTEFGVAVAKLAKGES